jgi:hypothetical protein
MLLNILCPAKVTGYFAPLPITDLISDPDSSAEFSTSLLLARYAQKHFEQVLAMGCVLGLSVSCNLVG